MSAASHLQGALRSRWAGPLCLVGLWALFFAPHLLGDGVPYYRDNLVTLLPIRHFLHERLRGGQLPMWYPHEALGVPFIGQIVTATFHPQTLLFLPLPAAVALKLNLLGGYLFGALGMYGACRALAASRAAAVCGASAFAFGGYALGVSHNLVYLMGLATLPWVLRAALRLAAQQRVRDCGLLMVAWALVFLAGDAQMFGLCPLLLGVALAIHGVGRRRLLLMALAGLGAVLLVCIELLPALSVSAESIRGVGTASPTLGLTWALHPLRLLELLIPGFVPDAYRNRMVAEVLGADGALWSTTVFAGGVSLLLAGVGLRAGGRPALALGALALLGLWLSLGDRGGLLPVVQRVLPLLSKFRFPEKYLALLWLGLAPLVARGFDALRSPARRRAAVAAAAAALACAAGAALAASGSLVDAVWAARGRTLAEADPLRSAVASAWGAGLGASALFLGLGALLLWLSQRRPGLLRLLPLLLFAELLQGNGAHLPLLPRALLEEPNLFAAPVEAARVGQGPSPRVTRLAPALVPSTVTGEGGELWVRTMRHGFHPDTNGLSSLAAFGTNLPATPARYGLLFGGSAERAAPWAAAFNGCFWSVALAQPLPAQLTPVARIEALQLGLARGPCAERAALQGVLPARDRGHALQRLRAGVAPGLALVEGAAALPPVQGQVQWLEYSPERLRLVTRAAGAAVLLVSDQWAPGWSATVDGEAAPVLPANVAARAVALPAGEHRVELRYRTPWLGTGVALSLVGVLLALTLLLWRPRAAGARV